MYKRYASVYDGSGQVRYALLIAPYLDELLRRHPTPPGRILDLACGTGSLALMFASEGYDVLGIDRSDEMLAQAMVKAANARLSGKVAFMQGDMRCLDELLSEERFSLVTCTYDSLNYLLNEEDLLACLQGVAHVLVPGGLFIGDMNTRYFLGEAWGSCEVQEHAGYVQVCQSHFDDQLSLVTMALTGFIGDDERGYERFDEVHVERAYPGDTVAALFATAGLHVEALYDCFTTEPPTAETHRVIWLARRVDAGALEEPGSSQHFAE